MAPLPLSDEARDLVLTHLPMVKHVLAGVAAHYPRHADREELAQAASLGLVEAAARFDPDRGVPFDRWAALRIRGAIVDAVRAQDFASRLVRSGARSAEAARADLEAQHGRTVTDDEVALRLGVTPEQLSSLQGKVHRALVLSLDARTGDSDGEGPSLASTIMDVSLQPDEVLEQRETARYVLDALDCLPERLRLVVTGYFLEGRTSAELARELRVTESRVSQMRADALLLMRRGLQAQYDLPAGSGDAQAPAVASRQSAFSAELASRSSYRNRLAALPRPRTAPQRQRCVS